MNRLTLALLTMLVAMALAACAGGPVRRVSEPAAAIQQLTVQADGHWTVALRIADALAARRSVAYTLAGRLDAVPEDGGRRSFDIDRQSAMTPVPGLPGVLR